jgi:pimeloyl-ACP methyl ester carboxylesterase
VAARNRAAFEWIQHEIVGRQAGLTTEQLTRIGDLRKPATPLTSGTGALSPLQAAALALADSMTAQVHVSDATFAAFGEALKAEGADEAVVRQKTVEAVATTATYNMVSRFLVALDIDDKANMPVPVPGFSEDDAAPVADPARGLVQVLGDGGCVLATRVTFHSMRAPWVVLINSLMTNLTMWDPVLSKLATAGYNVLSYDQRGHGASAVPAQPCTVATLADDVAELMAALEIPRAHAVIGVSQGGATALAFAVRHPELAERIVACDTQPASPAANAAAWDERIALAKEKGMAALADVTVPRWFAAGSAITEDVRASTHEMVARTKVAGFEAGARALQSYDLLAQGLVEKLAATRSLLVAGELDGKLPEVLASLHKDVAAKAAERASFASIPAAGHLPMLDNPDAWWAVVGPWLQTA